MTLKRLLIPITVFLAFVIVIASLGKWDWLLWGIILLCPLIHLFGHNHSGHNHSENNHSSHNHSKENESKSCH